VIKYYLWFIFKYYSKKNKNNLGRNKSNEQPIINDFDGQSDGFFAFSSPQTQSRRSYSRERSSNSFAKVKKKKKKKKLFITIIIKNSELNGNGYRSINNSQHRLHSISSYPNERQSSNIRQNLINGNNDYDKSPFDRPEKDFVNFFFIECVSNLLFIFF
jgi:hypothetical protein